MTKIVSYSSFTFECYKKPNDKYRKFLVLDPLPQCQVGLNVTVLRQGFNGCIGFCIEV
jgi:hypothetical protein